MTNTEKLILWPIIGVYFGTECLAVLGMCPSPFSVVVDLFRKGLLSLVLGTIGLHCFLLYAFSRPVKKEFVWVIVLGAVLFSLVIWLVDLRGRLQDPFYGYLYWCGSGLGLTGMFLIVRDFAFGDPESRIRSRGLLAIAVFIVLSVLTGESVLAMTATLHPETFDPIAFHFDQTLGFQASVTMALIISYAPWLGTAADASYILLPFFFAAFCAYQFSRENSHKSPIDPTTVWVVSLLCAFVAYHCFPVTGPIYAFTNQLFPASMPAAGAVPISAMLVPPAPRNGVPSMHFAWALILWLLAILSNAPRWRAFFAVVVGLTVIATLGKGEHFAIDLIIAVPFAIGILGLCSYRLGWGGRTRIEVVGYGFGLWLAWIVLLRTSIVTFVNHPSLSWLAIVTTFALSIWMFGRLRSAYLKNALDDSDPVWSSVDLPVAKRPEPDATNSYRKIVAMFVASGFAGLMYEVIFSKSLALTFGSTSTAAYTVLATYMGGMALGAWLGGRLATRFKHVILAYAACEFLIGIYCIATPLLFVGVQQLYVAIAAGVSPDAPQLTGLRILLGGAVLLVPTVIMGATLPLLVSRIDPQIGSLGRSVAVLYAANTLGAAAGAFLTGYAIIPNFGLSSSLLLAASINFLVSLAAIGFHKSSAQATTQLVGIIGPADGECKPSSSQRSVGVAAITVLTLVGIVTLALEVLYMHVLAVVVGNSTYAFSLMLATFLLGLCVGAESMRRTLRYINALRYWMGCLLALLAIFMLSAIHFWGEIPRYFGSFAGYPVALGFGARELIRGLVAFAMMFPPAFIIGAIYPLAMECVGHGWPTQRIRMLGIAASLNTVGNIMGVFLAGFVLLPFVGALHSIQLMALAVFGLSVWLILGSPARRWKFAPLFAVTAVALSQPIDFDYDKLVTGANVYFAPQNHGHVIAKAESVDGGLTTVSQKTVQGSELLTLLTNGKFQGNNSMGGEMVAQIGFAFAPLLHTEKRDSALVIGFGTGVTTRTLNDAGFNKVDVVDLSADIVAIANQYFKEVNAGVLSKTSVKTNITDGRNYLLLQSTQYDLIGLEVSSIWFAGAASLYNREFYQLAKARLRADGVLQQWMQLHHITPIDLMYIVGSIRSEFKYVWVYDIGDQGIVIASNDPDRKPNEMAMQLIDTAPSLATLRGIIGESAAALSGKLVLDPDAVDRMLNFSGVAPDHWISTDNNMFLEYSTPRGNALDGERSLHANRAFMRQFAHKM